MIPIINFILGFLLATVGSTLIEAICTFILCVAELVKAKISAKIAEYNSIIANYASQNQEQNSHVIGFRVPTAEEEEDYDEEDY